MTFIDRFSTVKDYHKTGFNRFNESITVFKTVFCFFVKEIPKNLFFLQYSVPLEHSRQSVSKMKFTNIFFNPITNDVWRCLKLEGGGVN